ncbi:MAG TPA: DNA-formamidopyrimidine glycosylase family protein [Candidatus Acidoferrum sp.]|nr:DNA-formamidopyrimidine glycosylase family protein [Candidatus Acidoferrum sp.]
MPELAEVEFYRRKWDAGIGAKITGVELHAAKRVLRGVDAKTFTTKLTDAKLLGSQSHGKQMAFQFSGEAWLGIHLGMTGELRVEPATFVPQKHDHLVLFQRERALVFTDARMFGRVLFHAGPGEPDWWRDLPPEVLSREFTVGYVGERLKRHRTFPLKAALLDQATFPGIGNWMADEILWQARINPRAKAGALSAAELKELWRMTRFVTKRAVDTIAKGSKRTDFGDPPKGFLFHVRWAKGGHCPRCKASLQHDTIGGRTTAWCPKCQPLWRD